MKVLLFGKDGQVGWELQRALALLGEVCAPGGQDASCDDVASLRAMVRAGRP